MLEAVSVYVNAVKRHTKYAIDEYVTASRVHENCAGKIDAYAIENDTIHVYAFKYGRYPVEVYENWELLECAAGVYDRTRCANIELTIVQPRAYHKDGRIRTWKIHESQLLKYIERLKRIEQQASDSSARCRPNPACTTCNARANCESLRTFTLAAVDYVSNAGTLELPGPELANELNFLQLAKKSIETRIMSIEEEAKAAIKRGDAIPGLRLESGVSHKTWAKPVAEVIALGEVLGIPLNKEPAIITPKQAIAAGFPPELACVYIKDTPGALKLTIDTSDNKFYTTNLLTTEEDIQL
jgi:hypothetical protein